MKIQSNLMVRVSTSQGSIRSISGISVYIFQTTLQDVVVELIAQMLSITTLISPGDNH